MPVSETNTVPLICNRSQGDQPASSGRLITLNFFHYGMASTLFLLKQTLILDIDFPSLYTMFLENSHPYIYRMSYLPS
jgi:hypothetical protein